MDGVFIPRDTAIKMVRFMNEAAGEGIMFNYNTPDELAADDILFEWLQEDAPLWLPKEIREDWKA